MSQRREVGTAVKQQWQLLWWWEEEEEEDRLQAEKEVTR